MQELSYEEVIHEIENKRRFGNLTGVEIAAKMLEQLSHPERGMNIIHVAGTNGKGSVSAFLCSILQRAGLKTGMFTSPHLVDFRERIRINGEMISKEDTHRLGRMLLETEFSVFPTMFDYCLLMAVLYFKEQQCDVVIMETGLGGRLDSTNALGVPKVSVITKIGYDHMAILGDTLDKIATEKAGIIKKGSFLVMESQEKEAEEVLLHARKEAGVEEFIMLQKDEILAEGIRNDIITENEACNANTQETIQSFSYGRYQKLQMQMLGVHQYENAAAALLAAEYFLADYWNLPTNHEKIEVAIREGIRHTCWKGRMEILSKNPFFLVDGAHNSNGVNALKESLMHLYPEEKFHFIMGVMADKDYEEMIEVLLPLALDFKAVTVESSRALQADALAECIREKGVPAVCCESLEEALPDFACPSEEKTIAFGSLYFIGDIEAYMMQETVC